MAAPRAAGPGGAGPDDPAVDPAVDPVGAALAPWLPAGGPPVLLAVSGGPDSAALMHAAARLPARCPVHVATVDHGLRPGSADEARAVGAAAALLGLPHAVLAWEGDARRSALQARARAARYRLLAAHAAGLGAAAVLTGHNADDQAETVLMRLAAGSGPAGLAGMRAARWLAPGLRLVRPLLAIPKADLAVWCAARAIPVLDDPANAAPRFARARWRRLAPHLAAEGLTRARLLRLAERAARDDDALEHAAAAALAGARRDRPDAGSACRGEPPGGHRPVHLDGRAVAGLPEAVALRLLARAMAEAGAGRIRLERLERLVLDALLPALRAGRPLRRTLAGLVVEGTADGGLWLAPEPPRTPVGSRVAGPADLLGKGMGSAYIADERPEGSEAPRSMRGAEDPVRSRD